MSKIKILSSSINNIEVSIPVINFTEISDLYFEIYEGFPWINVYKIKDTRKEFLLEIDEDEVCRIVTNEDLKVYALNWFFNNVEIVADNN